ncbi:hypothetical protein VNO78_10726 [Psophocarpus tetragonolobus]|uniref:Uncharacterized protein n=1 Tax=Psophocarpus tetragonolobus TaxID=3891 RepID=A0AAN9SL42_PSOTE
MSTSSIRETPQLVAISPSALAVILDLRGMIDEPPTIVIEACSHRPPSSYRHCLSCTVCSRTPALFRCLPSPFLTAFSPLSLSLSGILT